MNAEEHELNLRLARFVWPDGDIEIQTATTFPQLLVNWSPAGNWTYRGLPFTESLDTQAEHVWPKLEYLSCVQVNGWSSAVVTIDGHKGIAIDRAHALACAKAIDQAIREAKP